MRRNLGTQLRKAKAMNGITPSGASIYDRVIPVLKTADAMKYLWSNMYGSRRARAVTSLDLHASQPLVTRSPGDAFVLSDFFPDQHAFWIFKLATLYRLREHQKYRVNSCGMVEIVRPIHRATDKCKAFSGTGRSMRCVVFDSHGLFPVLLATSYQVNGGPEILPRDIECSEELPSM